MRVAAILVAVLLLTTTAVADNPANWVPNWSRAPKAQPSQRVPVQPSPAVQSQKPETAPAPSVESPRVQPRSVEKSAGRSQTGRTKQKRQADRKSAGATAPKPKQGQPEPLSGGGQATQIKCTPLPPPDCARVCSYARSMSLAAADSLRAFMGYCAPTSSQKAAGSACIRLLCPEVFAKKRPKS